MKISSFQGIVTSITNFWTGATQINEGCSQLISVQDRMGEVVNFIIDRTTYFVNHRPVSIGDTITGFYDLDVPVALIYPPQYRAVAIHRQTAYEQVKMDVFNNQLVSSDGMLQLHITPNTPIVLENGQYFIGNITNRLLLVVYGASTRSIPAQTTPEQIVVICR